MREETNEKTENQRIKIDYGMFDYFPTILDYDFEKKRPRGLSSRVDFFYYGSMSSVLDGIDPKPYVFVKKRDSFFENGMILADFSKIIEDPAPFLTMVKELKSSRIYLENSIRYPLDEAVKKLKNVEIVFLEA